VLNIVLTFGSSQTTGQLVANYVNPAKYREEAETSPRPFSQSSLMVYMQLTNFVPGLDGQVCFFHDDVFSYCRYSREGYLLEVDLRALSRSPEELVRAAGQASAAFASGAEGVSVPAALLCD